MSDYRDTIRALIDPAQTETLVGGRLLQHVTIMICDEEGQPGRLPPAVSSLRPADARELAFRLLVLAEQAELSGSRR